MKFQGYLVGDMEEALWKADLCYHDVDGFSRRMFRIMNRDLCDVLTRKLVDKITSRDKR